MIVDNTEVFKNYFKVALVFVGYSKTKENIFVSVKPLNVLQAAPILVIINTVCV